MGSSTTMSLESQAVRRAGGPKAGSVFRNVAAMRRDFLAYFESLFNQYGDVVKFGLPRTVHLIFHPDGVRHILKTGSHKYRKSKFFDQLEPMLGEGLLSSEGEVWKAQRRQLSPVFQHKVIDGFAPAIRRATERIVREWEKAARDGTPRDAHADMTSLTLSAATEIFFGAEAMTETQEVSRAFLYLSDYAVQRMIDVFPIPRWIPTPANLRSRKAVAVLDRIVYRILDARKGRPLTGDDMLSRLLQATDPETGNPISRKIIRDQVMTFLLAGHETTSNALAWTWHLLERHPEHGDALAAEVRAKSSAPATTVEYSKREVLNQILSESMRLYPPAPVISRSALEDDEIQGYFIPKGSIVETCPWVTHRHSEFWERPSEFEPERFSESRRRGQHPFAYFPFGGGPRECIGKSFAITEAAIALDALAGRFRLTRAPNAPPIELEAKITLRPKHGVWVKIEERR